MADFDAEYVSEPECDEEAGDNGDKRQEIIFAAGRTNHAFEKLPAIENADAVEKHDQADQPDRAGDLRLGREGAQGKTHEQHGADAEGESAQIDLADEIAQSNCQKYGEDRLRADNVLC